MKLKKFLPLFLLVLYITNLIPFSTLEKAQASQSNGIFTYFNADTTSVYNKYGVKGVVMEENIIQFDDGIIVVSSSGVYQIKNAAS
jgi:hypothetical protein